MQRNQKHRALAPTWTLQSPGQLTGRLRIMMRNENDYEDDDIDLNSDFLAARWEEPGWPRER